MMQRTHVQNQSPGMMAMQQQKQAQFVPQQAPAMQQKQMLDFLRARCSKLCRWFPQNKVRMGRVDRRERNVAVRFRFRAGNCNASAAGEPTTNNSPSQWRH